MVGKVINGHEMVGECQRIEALADTMRRAGIRTLEVDGIRIELGPEPEGEPTIYATEVIGESEGRPTADELMFWSTNEDLPSIVTEAPKDD